MPDSLTLLERLLETINKNSIPLVKLRYKPLERPGAFSGDFDFVTSEASLNQILQTIFDLATDMNISFSIDRTKFTKTKVTLFDTADQYIELEIWTILEVKDPARRTLRYIFWEDLAAHLVREENGIAALPLELEALYYLSHLFTKTKNLEGEEIRLRLEYYRTKLDETNKQQTLELFNMLIDGESTLREAALSANTELIDRGILLERMRLASRKKEYRLKTRTEWYTFKNSLRKLERFIPLVGPDGVGKTTLIESLSEAFKKRSRYYRFKKTFRGSIIYNTIYPILKRMALRRMQMKKIDKNQVDDLFGQTIFYIALIKYTLFILTNLIIRKYVFADRFFYDFLFQDMRFADRPATLRTNWKTLLKRSPGTYWLIQLDAPADVIFQRKQELSREDIATYRKEIFHFYLGKPSVLYTYINTANPLETCIGVLNKNSRIIH